MSAICSSARMWSPSSEPMYVHISPTLTDGPAYSLLQNKAEAKTKDLTPMRLAVSPQGQTITDLVGSPPPTIHESTHESDGSTTGGGDQSQRDSSPPSSTNGNSSPPRSSYGGNASEEATGSVPGSSPGGQRVRSRRTKTATAPMLHGPRTTLTLTGLPSYFTRKMLMVLLDKEGFERCYDLLYVPMDFEKQQSLGYALINLVSIPAAERCFAHFSTFPVTVAWSSSLQGLIPCVEKYRNSPIMHDLVPDELKPALFVEGICVPFPRPTIEIPEPVLKKIDAAC